MMRKNLCLFFIILFNQVLLGQESKSIRESIIPLLSTRADVEKIAKPVESNQNNKYETENEIIIVNYSEARCIGNGWNVKPDTVIDYTIYPGERIPITILDKNSNQLIRTYEHAGFSYYTDLQKGIQYQVYRKEYIKFVRYTPTEADSELRCKGFPVYDPVSEMYYPYQIFQLRKIDTWDVGLAGGFLIDTKNSTEMMGYIIVYSAKKESKSKINQLIKKLKNFSYKVIEVNPERLKIAFGGYRDTSEIETFLIPSEYPTPVSKPKYPS